MAMILNGQVGWFSGTPYTPPASTLWTNIYAVYNADSVGSSSLKTSLYAAYNGESNANDSFGSNNGTAVGSVTYATGKIGTAFQFAATNTYVNIPNTTDHLNFTGDFSISLWVNYNTTAASNEIFITNMKAGGTYGSGWFFQTDPSNLRFTINATSTQNSFGVPFTPSANTWYHFVVTRKRSTETKIYINGVLQSGTYSLNNPTVDPTYQAGQEYNIGAYILPQRYFSNIRIDALNIWTKELTSAEVSELYNSGNGAQYITDDFYKPTTNDALNTNNGTAQGGLTYGVGKVGTAFQFNGTNAFVSMVNNSFNLTGDFSISTWLYLTNTGSNQDLFSNADIVSSVDRGYRLSFRGPTNFIRFSIYGGSIVNLDTTTSAIPLNTWTHVVATRKASTGSKIYINGVLSTSDTSVVNPNYAGTFAPCIGVYKSTTTPSTINYLTNGSRIDALNIWNKELSTSEITELYNAGNGKQYPN